MSTADFLGNSALEEDDPDDLDANGEEEEEEEEEEEGAVDLMGENTGDDDSSEEEDDDSDAEREVRKGFIVDEEDPGRRRKKRRKSSRNEDGSRKRRKDKDSGDDVDDLDDDDLALMEENTGMRLGANRGDAPKLKRLRRRGSPSAVSDDGRPQNINNIFDDDAGGNALPFDQDEMAGFIEDDTQSEGSGSESGRRDASRQKQKKAQKSTSRRSGFGAGSIEGITAEAWQEVTDVFGNGKDYEYALEDEPEVQEEKALKDIFEPSEIASRMLTEEDDAIRDLDIPERLQLASSGLPWLGMTDDGTPAPYISWDKLLDATIWMASRVSPRCTEQFMLSTDDGSPPPFNAEYLEALKTVIQLMNIEFLEVPYIWAHRPDALVAQDNSGDTPQDVFLIEMADLWNIAALSIKYRALANRQAELRATFESLEVEDEYFETLFSNLESVEEIADANEWLAMKYASKLREVKGMARESDADDAPVRLKRATRDSRYETAKGSLVSKLAELIALPAAQLATDYDFGAKQSFIEDPDEAPLQLASQYGSETTSPQVTLSSAKMILVHEIAMDPTLRRHFRKYFQEFAVVSVRPTESGMAKIDEMHPFYAFKYLDQKPVDRFRYSFQFLEILAAEADKHVTSSITLRPAHAEKWLEDLKKIYNSDYTSSIAEEWNTIRSDVLEMAVNMHMLPSAELWMRNKLKDEAEEFVGSECARQLGSRINVAPFFRSDNTMSSGDVASVLSLSFGSGDPKRDSVIGVYLDSEGHLREHFKIDTLSRGPMDSDYDPANRDVLVEFLRRRRPQVITIGGFTPQTKDLMNVVRMITAEVSNDIVQGEDDLPERGEKLTHDDRVARAYFEVLYVFDDVARIYQNSRRAMSEFADLSTLGKYCVALARYVQSPLNEYAALGADITVVNYHPGQKYLSRDKLLLRMERMLVEITNAVGVDINRAIRDSYYYALLPFVAGLGPRKASALVKKINGPIGGTLVSRAVLVFSNVMTTNVFMNAASFLRIRQDELDGERPGEAAVQPDVLDETRIHPETYDVARKMAADAMELDEEDISAFKIPSQAIISLREVSVQKLEELSLDEFAAELFKMHGIPKRLLLYTVRREMKRPYVEVRPSFTAPTIGEVFTMLTGETPKTLEAGLIVPVRVLRVTKDDTVHVRLDSGIEGVIDANYRSDETGSELSRPRPGSTLQALVMELRPATFEVDLSTQPGRLRAGDFEARRVVIDEHYDLAAAQAEKEGQTAARQRGASGRQNRVIKHPNFHNFNSGQAEAYLANQQRGDCVIRPSSKEDHLAITWKVDTGIYQHIAVHELNKPNEFSIGQILRVSAKHIYSDLDELIVSHVKSMARKVDELTSHEKYRGSESELDLHLQNVTMANPGTSAYGFAINSKPGKGGQFMLSFRTSHTAEITSWPVKIMPGVFMLMNEEHGDVLSLCNAFKTAYQSKVASGTTPRYQMPGGRTPAYNYSSRTPLHAQSGRGTPGGGGATPNPWTNARTGNTPQGYSGQGRVPAVGGSSSWGGNSEYNRNSNLAPYGQMGPPHGGSSSYRPNLAPPGQQQEQQQQGQWNSYGNGGGNGNPTRY